MESDLKKVKEWAIREMESSLQSFTNPQINKATIENFKNIGYLIYEDKEMISLAFSYAIYDEDKVNLMDKFRDVLNIPKLMVIKRIKLNKRRNERTR